jgi:hypothetical protein
MFFPGVLRGRPGPRLATIHTSRPCRSLSSPWMLTALHSLARAAGSRVDRSAPAGTESDAVPSRFEEPSPVSGPRAFSGSGWRGLTPRWPRSLRLGSASGCNLARVIGRCKSDPATTPHSPRKASCGRHRGCAQPVARPDPQEAAQGARSTDGAGGRSARADRRASPQNESDAVPGRFEEPFPASGLGPSSGSGGAASHLGGLALCGSVPRLDAT